MVKFGRHTKFFLEHEHRDGSFVVPYNEVKSEIEEDTVELSSQDFVDKWTSFLDQARAEFDSSLQHTWQRIFAVLHEQEEARGAPPEKALLLFTQHAPLVETIHEVLDLFKSIHATALINTESLRKLVKKFDKHQLQKNPQMDSSSCSSILLSCQLLPQVYAANFVVGLSTLQQAVEVLRSELGLGEYAVSKEAAEAIKEQEMENRRSSFTAKYKKEFATPPGFPLGNAD
jgi:hypothetical protein